MPLLTPLASVYIEDHYTYFKLLVAPVRQKLPRYGTPGPEWLLMAGGKSEGNEVLED